ncbi:MAG: anti-sigma factor family protein [Candidatus Tyrphobacter sp.]
MNEHLTPETLIDYLHHELAIERDAAAHAHLLSCAACTAAYNAETRLGEYLRSDALARERDLPPGVAARVRGAVAREGRWLSWDRLENALRPAFALPAAAVIVLAAVLGFSSLRSHVEHAPSIAASYYLDDHAALSSVTLPFSQTAVVPEPLESNRSAQPSSQVAANLLARE